MWEGQSKVIMEYAVTSCLGTPILPIRADRIFALYSMDIYYGSNTMIKETL